jgi:hypothetical protein
MAMAGRESAACNDGETSSKPLLAGVKQEIQNFFEGVMDL